MAFDLKALRERARQVKVELIALSLAARDPRTPWYAKLIVAGCVAYALSPVDVIPDFIPVLGLVDELIFIPIALALAIRFIPDEVIADCRGRAGAIVERRSGRVAAAVIVGLWIALGWLALYLMVR